MQFAKLGNTGMTVSRICLGCMSYGGGPQLEWAIADLDLPMVAKIDCIRVFAAFPFVTESL